jgi:tetratricopeptide (TPR) repeat protein
LVFLLLAFLNHYDDLERLFFSMKHYLIFFLFFCISKPGLAQFFEDTTNKELTVKGLDFLYNQQFKAADEALSVVKRAYPSHPVSYLLSAFQLQWQNMPIDKNPKALKQYIEELENCIKTARQLYKTEKYRKEATFYLLAAYGFVALSHNYQKNYFDAANEAKKAHNFFVEGQGYKHENTEFLLSSGLYNYYRVQYPITHPIIKPAMIFFESGNKKVGLQELESASKQSVFAKIEAMVYLTNIYVKYETNFKKALQFSSQLYQKYPNNTIFAIKQAECLLLNADYTTAQGLIQKISQKTDNISTLASLVFEGFYEEHATNNPDKAIGFYAKALKIKMDERFTKEYHGMAYLGMARIFVLKKDNSKAKAFYKKCLEISEYNWVVAAATKELKVIK